VSDVSLSMTLTYYIGYSKGYKHMCKSMHLTVQVCSCVDTNCLRHVGWRSVLLCSVRNVSGSSLTACWWHRDEFRNV